MGCCIPVHRRPRSLSTRQLIESDETKCEISTLDEIKTLDISKLTPELREQIDLNKVAETYRNAKSISILLTGKTGSGKSTLVNGILGVNVNAEGAAKEGSSIKVPCTTEVTEYKTKKGKVDITVWDSPGLQDGTGDQESYLRQIKDKCIQRDLTMYCIKVADTRFVRGTDNPDVVAMKKLTESFKYDFWKNAIIVLTFANVLEAFNVEWSRLQPEQKSEAFQAVIQDWKEQVQEILMHDVGVPKEIVDAIPVIPAGHYLKRALPDREYWLSDLWFACINATQTPEAKAALIKINENRLKRKQEVKETDFKKQAEDQPIVVPDNTGKKIAIGGWVVGGIIGTGLGLIGLLAGPFAAITIPAGLMLGLAIGARLGAGVGKAVV